MKEGYMDYIKRQLDSHKSVQLVALNNGKAHISLGSLASLVPDVEALMFFGQLYKIPGRELIRYLQMIFEGTVLDLIADHQYSEELQDYMIEDIIPNVYQLGREQVTFEEKDTTILKYLFQDVAIPVLESIQELADKIALTIDKLPNDEGKMVFQHMARFNAKRNTIGQFQANIIHQNRLPNLVIFDDSGSVGKETVRALAEDVVALGYKANADLVLVSDTARYWPRGTYTVERIVQEAEYSGTRYETLLPIFTGSVWGHVITIADYDSSYQVRQKFLDLKGQAVQPTVEKVLDISLVQRPSYLCEVVGILARNVEALSLTAPRALPSPW